MNVDTGNLHQIHRLRACIDAWPPIRPQELHRLYEDRAFRRIHRCVRRLRTVLPGSFFLVDVPLDLHPAPADTMSFVPMNFGFGNRTILKTYGRVALQFAPVAAPEAFLKVD